MSTNILILGSGGREHALAWKLASSSDVENIFVAPGNPGMDFETLKLPKRDQVQFLVKWALENKIGLTIVGSESFLEQGVVDNFQKAQLPILGPSKKAAQIELSKIKAKEIMSQAEIPTASYESFDNFNEAQTYIQKRKWPDGLVIKASGPMAGKGVKVCDNQQEGILKLEELVREMPKDMDLLIEERLSGREVSAFYLVQDEEYRFMGMACDYKRLLDGNLGPNTGGMGAYSPVKWIDTAMKERVEKDVVVPLLKEMINRGTPYKGLLFIGLMISSNTPYVLEFNARLGDPEAQVLLPLIDEDLFPWFKLTAEDKLSLRPKRDLLLKEQSAVHVVMAHKNYPYPLSKVQNLDADILKSGQMQTNNLKVFFAGAKKQGRIMGATAWAFDLEKARSIVYKQIKKIKFEGARWRSDIGK